MRLFRYLLLVLFAIACSAACTPPPDKEKAKVICPACGTDFDALYHSHF